MLRPISEKECIKRTITNDYSCHRLFPEISEICCYKEFRVSYTIGGNIIS